MRATKQRLVGLEQGARQPRLAMGADVPLDTKTRNRMEDIAADRVIREDSSSVNRGDPDHMCLTSFGDDFTEPPAFPCSRDDAVVDNGAAAPNLCLSPAEMRTRTAADGLLPAGIASTTMRTIFPRPLFSWSLVVETKKRACRASIRYASYYSSFWKLKVLETKSRQLWSSIPAVLQVIYEPARFGKRYVRCFVGRFSLRRWLVAIWSGFGRCMTRNIIFRKRGQAIRAYCG